MTWEGSQEEQARLLAQVQHHLTPKNPRLDKQADYYREQANDTSNTALDRALWKQMADELDARLGRESPERPAAPPPDPLF